MTLPGGNGSVSPMIRVARGPLAAMTAALAGLAGVLAGCAPAGPGAAPAPSFDPAAFGQIGVVVLNRGNLPLPGDRRDDYVDTILAAARARGYAAERSYHRPDRPDPPSTPKAWNDSAIAALGRALNMQAMLVATTTNCDWTAPEKELIPPNVAGNGSSNGFGAVSARLVSSADGRVIWKGGAEGQTEVYEPYTSLMVRRVGKAGTIVCPLGMSLLASKAASMLPLRKR